LPFIELQGSALAGDISPVRIHYREYGNGFPLIYLHGGWGYQVYPFDRQIAELKNDFRIIIPDRAGYGRSTKLSRFPFALHSAACEETIAFLDRLEVPEFVLWGHSDGAIIGANVAIKTPERVKALIMEATHYDRHKPKSRAFFTNLVVNPEVFGESVIAKLVEDHGADYWRQVLNMEGQVWLDILDNADRPEFDLFENRLANLSVPTMLLHGEQDPRTEPGELEAIHRLVPAARLAIIPDGKHSPHSERLASDASTMAAKVFLSNLFRA